jgi:hypothetical protein
VGLLLTVLLTVSRTFLHRVVRIWLPPQYHQLNRTHILKDILTCLTCRTRQHVNLEELVEVYGCSVCCTDLNNATEQSGQFIMNDHRLGALDGLTVLVLDGNIT